MPFRLGKPSVFGFYTRPNAYVERRQPVCPNSCRWRRKASPFATPPAGIDGLVGEGLAQGVEEVDFTWLKARNDDAGPVLAELVHRVDTGSHRNHWDP